MEKQVYTDYKKEFRATYGCYTLSITRGEYASMTLSMIAEEMSDEKMMCIARDVCMEMYQRYGDELALLERYRKTSRGMTDEEIRKADKMDETESELIEKFAQNDGMRYWEDLDDDEYETLKSLIEKETA